MSRFRHYMRAFLREEKGLTAVEYAIAGGLIAIGGIAAFANLGSEVVRVIELLLSTLANVAI